MDSATFYALYISLASIGVSITTFVVTFIRQQKSQQFRLALELNEKLKETVNQFAEFNKEPHNSTEIKTAKRFYALQYLETLEFFSFLVRNNEITNENIINYFKPSMIAEAKKTFQDYPDVGHDDKLFEEIKDLLKKWGEL